MRNDQLVRRSQWRRNDNCDDNDAVWREDSDDLTDKPTLRVKKLKFGDTRANSGVDGKGKIVVLWYRPRVEYNDNNFDLTAPKIR